MGQTTSNVLIFGAAAAVAAAWFWPRHETHLPDAAIAAPGAPRVATAAATTRTTAAPVAHAAARVPAAPAGLAEAREAAAHARTPRASQHDTATDGALVEPTEPEQRQQARINAYFDKDVIPRLRPCWAKLGGTGAVTLAQHYVIVDGRWVPATDEHLGVEVDDSDLDESTDESAAACMREAVRGTSWPIAPGEENQPTYVLYWRWPVPFPPPAAE